MARDRYLSLLALTRSNPSYPAAYDFHPSVLYHMEKVRSNANTPALARSYLEPMAVAYALDIYGLDGLLSQVHAVLFWFPDPVPDDVRPHVKFLRRFVAASQPTKKEPV